MQEQSVYHQEDTEQQIKHQKGERCVDLNNSSLCNKSGSCCFALFDVVN